MNKTTLDQIAAIGQEINAGLDALPEEPTILRCGVCGITYICEMAMKASKREQR